jgi:hypothetical protein
VGQVAIRADHEGPVREAPGSPVEMFYDEHRTSSLAAVPARSLFD